MSQNTQTIFAASAGTVQLGDRTVNRLGFGAMRITGKGIWDRQRIAMRLCKRCGAWWNSG